MEARCLILGYEGIEHAGDMDTLDAFNALEVRLEAFYKSSARVLS
jgi:hypothetical protein